MDGSVAHEPLELGPVSLHVSGGTNELERDMHRLPPEARRAARVELERSSLIEDDEQEVRTSEGNAGQKLLALTRLMVNMAPLMKTVVLPWANHIALPMGEFVARSRGCLREETYSAELWTFFKIRPDEGGAHVSSMGMWTYGLPEVAAHLPADSEPMNVVERLAELQGRMIVGGWWPEEGTTLTLCDEEARLRAMPDALWVEGHAESNNEVALARRRYRLLRTMQVIVGDATHFHTPAEENRPAIEHLLRPFGESVAITNGLSFQTQPGGTEADENERVELSLTAEKLGPWAEDWLEWAASYFRGHDGSSPIHPFDRLVLPEPNSGIAGAIVWPSGHLHPGPDQARVHLWDIMPVLPRELEAFRADPKSQTEWIDAHFEAGDQGALHERWRSVISSS